MRKLGKSILALSMVGILTLGTILPVFADKVETTSGVKEVIVRDLPKDAWYTDIITDLVEKGILQGHDGLVKPNANVTRAEYAQILHNIRQEEGLLDLDGTDVKESDWFYHAMRAAITHGIIRGDGGDSYKPNGTLTREEVFTMTARAFQLGDTQYTEDGVEIVEEDLTLKFKDNKDLSNWSRQYTSALIKEGYLKGNQDQKLLPNKNITRAELASIVKNIKEVKELKPIITVTNK